MPIEERPASPVPALKYPGGLLKAAHR